MKTKLIFAMLTFGAIALFAAKTTVELLTARSDGNSIIVEWRCGDESQIKLFDIERASKNGSYKSISTQEPKGTGYSYRFNDTEALYKKGTGVSEGIVQAENVFTYRIKIIYKNGSSDFTDPVYVTHNVSSIRRTWGMIKEMFR